MVTTLYMDFSDSFRQLTLLLVGCGLNSSRKIQLKMKMLEWSQHFSHCKSMGIFPDAQGQLNTQLKLRSDKYSSSFKL